MKAAYYLGDKKFQIRDGAPLRPGPGEVRLNVAYSGICGTDFHIYLGHMDHRIKPPQVIGHEMSGTVVETGEGVTGVREGDKVVVRPLVPCGRCPACHAGHYNVCHNINVLGVDTPGVFQTSWTVPASTLHRLPEDIDLKLAALIEPAAVAAHDVRYGQVAKEDYVVVLGAGPIGMLVALEAKVKGARILVTEVNPFRLNLARELGLEAVNPEETNVAQQVMEQTGGAGADVVFEVTGTPRGAEVMTGLARSRGRIVVVGIFARPAPVTLSRVLWAEQHILGARLYEPEDFETAISLVASGALPVERLISDIRPLEQIQATFEEIEGGAQFVKVLFHNSD